MKNNAFLEIDLKAIARNYQKLKDKFSGNDCGAVVKSNAYGLGMTPIANALHQKGCRDFFVMDLQEGVELKKNLPHDEKNKIYLLRGVCSGQEWEIIESGLIPVISSQQQLHLWYQAYFIYEKPLDTVISINIGMNREGLDYDFGKEFLLNLHQYKGLNILFWQGHLSSAYNLEDVTNREELNKVKCLQNLAPQLKISLCNSGGIFLGNNYHFQLCRPGMGLYGLNPLKNQPNPLELSVALFANVTQIRFLTKGETVGYDHIFVANQNTKVATLAIGYADGLSWRLSNCGYVMFENFKAPIIGRISMNYITVDVTNIPEALVYERGMAKILGGEHSPEIMAELCQTTPYEILTNFGSNLHKVYV